MTHLQCPTLIPGDVVEITEYNGSPEGGVISRYRRKVAKTGKRYVMMTNGSEWTKSTGWIKGGRHLRITRRITA